MIIVDAITIADIIADAVMLNNVSVANDNYIWHKDQHE